MAPGEAGQPYAEECDEEEDAGDDDGQLPPHSFEKNNRQEAANLKFLDISILIPDFHIFIPLPPSEELPAPMRSPPLTRVCRHPLSGDMDWNICCYYCYWLKSHLIVCHCLFVQYCDFGKVH